MCLRASGQCPVIVLYILITNILLRGYSNLSKNGAEILFVNDAINATWDSYENPISDENFTIKTEGCIMPSLNFLDTSIRDFVHYPTNVTPCPNSRSPLLGNNETHIWIIKLNYPHYNITKERHFHCCYKVFHPKESTNKVAHNYRDPVEYEGCKKFRYIIPVYNEFMRVTCTYESNILYDQFFVFAQKKHFTKQRSDPFKIPDSETAYNVILMGVSSVSRLNFHRTMPKTLKLLKAKGAVELMGYNKVSDDNNFSNLIPVLVGMSDVQLRGTCWPNGRTTFDRCPFIWERFKDVGYYTALLEDSAHLSIFNVNRFAFSGFNSHPTDYYMYPFVKESEIVTFTKPSICMGNKYFFRVMLDYISNLTTRLKSNKLFGFYWESSMSHKYLNYPMLMDHSYESFIRKLDSSGYLKDTILILLSDHGVNVGQIYKTKQGQFEEKLPFVHILTPPSFREKYSFAYDNLKRNSRRLTTPFDIHSTLVDLIDLNSINDYELVHRSKTNYATQRAISLFLPIPSNRTCKIAEINKRLCTCLKSYRIPANSVIVREASTFLMKYLNDILKAHPRCASLSVEQIIEATEMKNSYENKKGWRDYRVVVRAMPGAGVFEAILRRDDHNWSVAGPVSRLNLYSDQSRCVQEYQMKMFCFCI